MVDPPSPAAPASIAPSPKPEEKRGTLVIHGTGDVNLDPNYISTYRSQGYGYAWSGLRRIFEKDDLTVINLECAVTNQGSAQAKEFTFQGDPKALPAARKAGVEVANLGNNHSQDFGKEAMLDTIANLDDAKIAHVGAGKDARAANEPAIFNVKGWKVAVLGFGGVVPTGDWIATNDSAGMADGDSISSMVRAVQRADRQADVVIVAIHWGVELDTQPRQEDVERAEAMIDAGADAIFGHHAHRLQPMEVYKGRPVFYGLGNFVWPNTSVEGATTAVAEVTVKPNGEVKGKMLPAFIEAPGHPVLR